jgi:hypothetical protein
MKKKGRKMKGRPAREEPSGWIEDGSARDATRDVDVFFFSETGLLRA